MDYLSFSMTLPKRWLPAFDTESTAFSATLFFFATGSRSDGFRNGGAVDAGYGSTESTQHTASISNLTPGSASVSASASGLSRQDSGVAGAGSGPEVGRGLAVVREPGRELSANQR